MLYGWDSWVDNENITVQGIQLASVFIPLLFDSVIFVEVLPQARCCSRHWGHNLVPVTKILVMERYRQRMGNWIVSSKNGNNKWNAMFKNRWTLSGMASRRQERGNISWESLLYNLKGPTFRAKCSGWLMFDLSSFSVAMFVLYKNNGEFWSIFITSIHVLQKFLKDALFSSCSFLCPQHRDVGSSGRKPPPCQAAKRDRERAK